MIEQLVDLLEKDGCKIEDKSQLIYELKEARDNDRFLTLYDNDLNPCGFLTWWGVKHQEKTWVYLSNCYIDPKQRNKIRLFDIKDYFKRMFPDLEMIYWARDLNGKDKYYYMKG